MTASRSIVALLLLLAPAAALGAEPTPAGPRCDQCQDLAGLLQEIKEQEWLRDKFREYTPDSSYQLMAADVAELQQKVQSAFNKWLDSPEGGGGGRSGAPAMGTDPQSCKLVFYDKDASGKQVTKPYDRKVLERFYCKTTIDFMLAHERSHAATCRHLKKQGKSGLFTKPAYVAADEVKAYEEGLKVLRKASNEMQKKCSKIASARIPQPGGEPAAYAQADIDAALGRAQTAAAALAKGLS